jgi:hypothetical protein
MKSGCSGAILSTNLPNEFGEMLTYSRSLKFDELPDHGTVRHSFMSLAERIGCSLDSKPNEPLDWTPCDPKITPLVLDEPEVSIPDEDEDGGDGGDDLGKNSYYGWDIDCWDYRQGERDKDLTLPAKQEVELDSITPLIVEVQDNIPKMK